MLQLLINQSIGPEATAETCFGGLPSAPENGEFTWPTCQTCEAPMQFLGQLNVQTQPAKLLLLFMCQNDPGMCDEWDANAGGNRVVAVATDALQLVSVPENEDADNEIVRQLRYGAEIYHSQHPDFYQARDAWETETGRSAQDVLGQWGGEPGWVQGDDTPNCEHCGQPMHFVASLEEGPGDMNFGGGGCAYVFDCPCNSASAKFLWQC